MVKKIVFLILIIIIVVAGFMWWQTSKESTSQVTNFEECVAAGNPVMESYPRQCRHGDTTFTEKNTAQMTREEASKIAGQTKDCTMAGIPTDDISYNAITKTWWIDLERMPELENDGCNPARVVSEQTKTAEVNWRCTGAMMPESAECLPEQRNVDACIEIYQPVCATVQVQCITTPCDPVKETFPNYCYACKNSLVSSYVEGECK